MTSTARATLMLVAANLVVYFVILGAWLTRGFFPELTATLTDQLSLSPSVSSLATHPWRWLTYMFTHLSFVHLTVNMLWLIGFGPMIKGSAIHTVAAYLAGGICGGLAFILCQSTGTPEQTDLAGASAAVLSVVTATATMSPRRRLKMIVIGEVKLIWVALAAMLTLIAGYAELTPVTAAHMAGVLSGLILGFSLRRYNQATIRKGMETARRHTRKLSLIHKAAQSGFASLSEPERLELFDLQTNRHK